MNFSHLKVMISQGAKYPEYTRVELLYCKLNCGCICEVSSRKYYATSVTTVHLINRLYYSQL